MLQHMKDKKDPIENLQRLLLKNGEDEKSLKEIDQEIKDTVSLAAQFAVDSDEPNLSELYDNIYASSTV